MGMRKYFNQLSLSLVRIRNTKLAMANKNQEKEKAIEEEDEEEKEAPELVDAKTTGVTNPPSKKKKGAGKGKS